MAGGGEVTIFASDPHLRLIGAFIRDDQATSTGRGPPCATLPDDKLLSRRVVAKPV